MTSKVTYYKPNKDDGAIIPPVHFSTTFEFDNNGGYYDGSVPREEWEAANRFKFNNDCLIFFIYPTNTHSIVTVPVAVKSSAPAQPSAMFKCSV